MNTTSYQQYLAPCCAIAKEAGGLIMGYFTGRFETRSKGEAGPVTDADVAANRLITEALARLAPDIPVIAEEDESHAVLSSDTFWLVDPLDGTRAFINGEPEFTVNIGLIHQGLPVLGVIYVPPQELLYFASAGKAAFKSKGGKAPYEIAARTSAADGLVVVRSKSHPSAKTAEYLETLAIKEMIAGSSSVKFCMVAEGSADIYPRFGRTMEWDTAAGHAILNAAGGYVETADGKPLTYGKPGFENPHFIAFGK